MALSDDKLSPEVAAILAEPRFAHAHWGVLVVDAESGARLEEKNPANFFAPASVTKLFSTAAALDDLGSGHRFETRVLSPREPTGDGVLTGDLVLVASGDPTLGGRTTPDGKIAFVDSDHTYADFTEASLVDIDPLQGLNALAKDVAKSGVKEILGEALVDDRLFEAGSSSGSGPTRVTPLMVNDNAIDFLIEPAMAGEPAKVTVRPMSRVLQVDARVDTVVNSNEFTIRMERLGPYRFHLRGKISQGHRPMLKSAEVEDPTDFGRTLFMEALERAGVRLQSGALAGNDRGRLPESYRRWKRLAVLTSPPFSENAKLILKVSHNLHASALPLLMAARHGETSALDGLRREGEFLRRAGIPADGISFGGGAGGERADYVTPEAAVTLLRYMAKHRDAAAYEEALPILGVDGTLASAVDPNSAAKARARAKTGTLLWDNHLTGGFILTSKALAGYLDTSKNHRLVFALFVNGVILEKSNQTSEIGRALGRICAALHAKY